VRTVEQFEQLLKTKGRPDYVSFDNDLGKDENGKLRREGHHAAKILCDMCLDNNWVLPRCYIHSKNTQGSESIMSHLHSFIRFQKELSHLPDNSP